MLQGYWVQIFSVTLMSLVIDSKLNKLKTVVVVISVSSQRFSEFISELLLIQVSPNIDCF